MEENEDHRNFLFSNYIFFIDKLFKQSTANLHQLLSTDKKESQLLTFDKSEEVAELLERAKALKDELRRAPSGPT
ncbi:hypothetical protein WDW86_04935 [Bdellovibrionota bacterium FG-2]